MECPACGRYAPPDPDTGYDADEICGDCSRQGWYIASDGAVVLSVEQKLAAMKRVEAVGGACEFCGARIDTDRVFVGLKTGKVYCSREHAEQAEAGECPF